jgi:hypothetical protein
VPSTSLQTKVHAGRYLPVCVLAGRGISSNTVRATCMVRSGLPRENPAPPRPPNLRSSRESAPSWWAVTGVRHVGERRRQLAPHPHAVAGPISGPCSCVGWVFINIWASTFECVQVRGSPLTARWPICRTFTLAWAVNYYNT